MDQVTKTQKEIEEAKIKFDKIYLIPIENRLKDIDGFLLEWSNERKKEIIQNTKVKIKETDETGNTESQFLLLNELGRYYESINEYNKAYFCYYGSLIIGGDTYITYDNLLGLTNITIITREFGILTDLLSVLSRLYEKYHKDDQLSKTNSILNVLPVSEKNKAKGEFDEYYENLLECQTGINQYKLNLLNETDSTTSWSDIINPMDLIGGNFEQVFANIGSAIGKVVVTKVAEKIDNKISKKKMDAPDYSDSVVKTFSNTEFISIMDIINENRKKWKLELSFSNFNHNRSKTIKKISKNEYTKLKKNYYTLEIKKKLQSNTYNYMDQANKSKNKRNFDEADTWYKKAYLNADESDNQDLKEMALIGRADLLLSIKKPEEALKHYRTYIGLCFKTDKDPDPKILKIIKDISDSKDKGNQSGKNSVKNSEKIKEEKTNPKGELAIKTALDHMKRKKYDLAKWKFKDALQIFKIDKNELKQAEIFTYFGQVLENQHEKSKALEKYKTALEICKKIDNYNMLSKIYRHISNIYRDWDELDEANKFTSLADEFFLKANE